MQKRTTARITISLAAALVVGSAGTAAWALDLPVPGQPLDAPSSAAPDAEAAADSPAEPDDPASAASQHPEDPAASADPRQAWADEKVQAWLDVWSLESVDGLLPPFDLVESWESPAEGELVLHVDPAITATDTVHQQDLGPANDLWMIGAVMMQDTWEVSPDLETITARTSDGARTETYTRQDRIGPETSGQHDPATQAWADEIMDLWVQAEGAQTVEGMLHPFDLIRSWEAAGPGELTIYTDPAILQEPAFDRPREMGPHHGITRMVMGRLYCGAPELQRVTVMTVDGREAETMARSEQDEQTANGTTGCLE